MSGIHQLNLGWGSFALHKGCLGAGLSKKPLYRVIEFMQRYEYVPNAQDEPLPVCYPAGKMIEVCGSRIADAKTFIVMWTAEGGVIGMTLDEQSPSSQYEASLSVRITGIYIQQLKPLHLPPTYSGFIESLKIDGQEMLPAPVATCIFQSLWGWKKRLQIFDESAAGVDEDEFDYATI